MTTVNVGTRTHSVTFVTDNLLRCIKDIIVCSGLDPGKFWGNWDTYQRGIKTWLESEHLERVTLEVYHPLTDCLIGRWDFDIEYRWSSDDGAFWVDTDLIRYAIKKAGLLPSQAEYRLVTHTKTGRLDVTGWSPTTLRSTDGMVRQSLGSAVQHQGLGGTAAYWRKSA